MNKLIQITLLVLLGLGLGGCFNSSSDEAPPPLLNPGDGTKVPTGVIGSNSDGQTYFDANCGVCHAANPDDTTTAFTATDLAGKQDMIATDMSGFDTTTQMMTTMSNIPQQRVNDLKAYLGSL